MCINPSTLPTGHVVGCSKCWQCIEVRIQDWVGRCIAESRVCKETYSITLTYGGGDHERATVLTYSDVQKFFKRLRKAGYRFKYLVAGEYGARKGRAHWHAMMFFDGKAPPHKTDTNFTCQFWPHGHTFWQEPTPKSVRYVCKYIMKATDDSEAQGKFMMSKKPPIGREYFMQLADNHVKNGLAPLDLKYYFDENRNKDGEMVPHLMQGAIARDFLDRFLATWHSLRPGVPIPETTTETKRKRGELSPLDQHIFKYVEGGDHLPRRLPIRTIQHPDWLIAEGAKFYPDHVNCVYYCHHNGAKYEWRQHEGTYKWLNAQTRTTADRRAETTYELDIYLRLAKLNRARDQEELRLARLDPLRLENYVSGRMKLPKTVKRWSTQMVGELRRPLALTRTNTSHVSSQPRPSHLEPRSPSRNSYLAARGQRN